jgi:hypothetical protein
MNKKTLKIAKVFSDIPGARYIKEGSFSGELFRNEILSKEISDAIKNNYILEIDLDGTEGYGVAFLEESFGGIIRDNGLKYQSIIEHIELISEEEDYLIEDIFGYLEDANSEKN